VEWARSWTEFGPQIKCHVDKWHKNPKLPPAPNKIEINGRYIAVSYQRGAQTIYSVPWVKIFCQESIWKTIIWHFLGEFFRKKTQAYLEAQLNVLVVPSGTTEDTFPLHYNEDPCLLVQAELLASTNIVFPRFIHAALSRYIIWHLSYKISNTLDPLMADKYIWTIKNKHEKRKPPPPLLSFFFLSVFKWLSTGFPCFSECRLATTCCPSCRTFCMDPPPPPRNLSPRYSAFLSIDLASVI